jgi:DNA-binding LacI/PurR family transcriptional regulator
VNVTGFIHLLIILRERRKVKMATTIRHVAAAAGVSVATASRALSGSHAVVPATSERVHRVASELGYTPSRLGRSLATGSTGNVGVILPDVTNPFYTSFLAELESALGAHDMGILVGDSHETPALETGLIERMSTQVDALVLASSRLDDKAIVAASARLPVVLANRRLDPATPAPARLSQITIDMSIGFSEAVRYLHALGHRSIGYVDGPAQSWSGRQKAAAIARTCDDHDMVLFTVATARPDFEGGRSAYGEIARLPVQPTAIVAFNDEVALGLLSALRDAGRSVPGDVSVVGCDNSLPEGMAWPALTTVDSSSRTLGALAAAAILNPDAPRCAVVSTALVVRDSTAAAREPLSVFPSLTEELSS